MTQPRDLSYDFLDAMREKLEHGRRQGYVGWDQQWKDCNFWRWPKGPTGDFITRLLQETAELIVALQTQDPDAIRSEAADVANFAMFIADIHGALKEDENDQIGI